MRGRGVPIIGTSAGGAWVGRFAGRLSNCTCLDGAASSTPLVASLIATCCNSRTFPGHEYSVNACTVSGAIAGTAHRRAWQNARTK